MQQSAKVRSYGDEAAAAWVVRQANTPVGFGPELIEEFPDYESALAAYRSEEYQEIKKLRLNTATIDLVIVEGFDPPAH